MAIQNRRGLKKDFDPTKMLPGEFAVSIDSETENQIVWMCFAPGVVKRIGTYEDFQKYLDENCKTAYEYAVDGGYTGTEDEFKSKMAQECADVIVASSSGTVIPLSDSAEAKLKGLIVHGKSTQDGTPTTSATIEIVNAGKYNEATGKHEVEVKVTGKNIIPNDGISITEESIYIDRYNGGLIARKGVTYTLSTNYAVTALYVRDYNDFNTIKHLNYNQKSISYTPQEDECLSFSVYNSSGIPEDTVVQLEVGTTATSYEAYKEQTVTLSLSEPIRSLPDGTGDIVHVDRATGTAWVERKIIEFVLDGSSDELWSLAGTNTSGKYRPDCYSYRNICKGYTDNTIPSNVYCNQFVAMSPDKNYLNNESIAIRYGGDIYIYEEEYSEKTLDEFRARLSANPITVIAELATPTTEELSAETVNQLLALTAYYPNTTITTDQGVTMDVDYVADTKNYIDNKFAELQAALLATGANV